MISKRAVRAFLERERKDWRKFKKLSSSQLREKRDALPVKPPIWKTLYKHQKVCFLLGAMHRFWGFFIDTGMGKTLLTIALGRYFKKLGEAKHILILVPNKINKAEWAREFRKWNTKSFVVLKGSSEAKWAALRKTKALFVVATYPGLVHMVCDLVPGRKRGKKQLKPNRKLVQELVDRFQGFVCDESTNVASRSALATRVLRQLRKHAKFGYELTGTPFGRDPTALHSQLFLLDQGYTLGETLGLFRAAFFTEKKNYWGGYIYTFKKEMEPTLNRFLADRTTRYEADQSDLPDYVEIIKEVSLPSETLAYAERARRTLIAAAMSGDISETKGMFLRMRQISSGWLGFKNDTTGEKSKFEFAGNPKMEALLALLESIGEDQKAIVFYDYTPTGDMICRDLTAAGVSWGRISGKTKAHEQVLANFDRPSGPRVLVLNNRFSMGPNLQAARYGIWFEEPLSCIIKKQGRRRFERQGSQHKKVFGYSLVARGTYDARIIEMHKQGRDLFKAIIEGKATRKDLKKALLL